MDTRTGEIHELNTGETVDELAKRLGGKPSDYVPISHRPDRKVTPMPMALKYGGWR